MVLIYHGIMYVTCSKMSCFAVFCLTSAVTANTAENYRVFFFCNDPCNVVLQRSAIGETFYFKIVVIATQQFMVITSKIPALQSSSR